MSDLLIYVADSACSYAKVFIVGGGLAAPAETSARRNAGASTPRQDESSSAEAAADALVRAEGWRGLSTDGGTRRAAVVEDSVGSAASATD